MFKAILVLIILPLVIIGLSFLVYKVSSKPGVRAHNKEDQINVTL